MSPQKRQRINLRFAAGFASSAALALALACSSSEPKGSLIDGTCDPAVDAACGLFGMSCLADAECASGSCEAGACVASSAGDDCEGANCSPMGGGGSFGDTFLVDDFDPSQGGSGEPTVCVDLAVDFTRVNPTVVLLIDRSGSMTQAFDNDLDRWDTLVNTLTDPDNSLLKKLEDSVRFGMSLYTSEGGFGGTVGSPRVCPILTNVDIALGNFSSISSVLSAAGEPLGDTPTAESMAAVAAQLQAFAEDGPKSIILATDGDPDTCEDPNSNNSNASKLLSVAAVRDAFTAGIATHVISVGDEVTATHLKDLAVAGAGGDAAAEAYQALDTTSLVDAFNTIIGSVRTCDFTLEGTVEADDAARGKVILDGQELGFGDPNGWEMPDEQTVRLVGEACETVQADASGISMSFPCDAIQIIPR